MAPIRKITREPTSKTSPKNSSQSSHSSTKTSYKTKQNRRTRIYRREKKREAKERYDQQLLSESFDRREVVSTAREFKVGVIDSNKKAKNTSETVAEKPGGSSGNKKDDSRKLMDASSSESDVYLSESGSDAVPPQPSSMEKIQKLRILKLEQDVEELTDENTELKDKLKEAQEIYNDIHCEALNLRNKLEEARRQTNDLRNSGSDLVYRKCAERLMMNSTDYQNRARKIYLEFEDEYGVEKFDHLYEKATNTIEIGKNVRFYKEDLEKYSKDYDFNLFCVDDQLKRVHQNKADSRSKKSSGSRK